MSTDWEDPDYDQIDYLIDNDPIELGKQLREAKVAMEKLRLNLMEARALLFGVHKNGDAMCCLGRDHVDAIERLFSSD